MKTYDCCGHCLHDAGEPEPYEHLQPCEEGCNDEPEGDGGRHYFVKQGDPWVCIIPSCEATR